MSDASVFLRFETALSTFKPSPSLTLAPNDWLAANVQDISATISICSMLVDTTLPLLIKAPCLFPRCFVYMYGHMKLIANMELLKSLEAKQCGWNQQNMVTQLVNYGSISAILWDFVRRCENMSTHTCGARDHIKKLVQLDFTSIAANILAIVRDPFHKEHFLAQRNLQAQLLLDTLQSLLDLPYFDSRTRSPILSSLIELSKRSCRYPGCLNLRGVQRLGPHAVDLGGFGDIWRGKLGGHAVAIKMIRRLSVSEADKSLKSILREAVLWRQFSHPHILPFLGTCHLRDALGRICLVSPWITNGNIVQFLEGNPQADRRSLLRDVASGLEYLHPRIIHGDLKGANILVTSKMRACLADFGLSSVAHDSLVHFPRSSGPRGGTLRWLAPELLQGSAEYEHKSLANDIYAFGCVCYEVFVGHPPFVHLNDFHVINNVVNGTRPPRPSEELCTRVGLDDIMWQLIDQCWQSTPTQRPTASEILVTLSPPNVAECGIPNCDLEEEFSGHLLSEGPLFVPTCHDENALHEHWLDLIADEDVLIAVMGPSGTGKSSFINVATGRPVAPVGHGLKSCTQDIRAFRCNHLHYTGRTVILVDTPGFEDSEKEDFEILQDIADWLTTTYKERITLSGLLYFHDISEPRMRWTPRKNLEMFEALCGAGALCNVMLTTTMWSHVGEQAGHRHEQQLRAQFWEPMLSQGCRMTRFHYTWESAWDIINAFSGETRRRLQLQEELVDKKKELTSTTAFIVLRKLWDSFTARWDRFAARSFRKKFAPHTQGPRFRANRKTPDEAPSNGSTSSHTSSGSDFVMHFGRSPLSSSSTCA